MYFQLEDLFPLYYIQRQMNTYKISFRIGYEQSNKTGPEVISITISVTYHNTYKQCWRCWGLAEVYLLPTIQFFANLERFIQFNPPPPPLPTNEKKSNSKIDHKTGKVQLNANCKLTTVE